MIEQHIKNIKQCYASIPKSRIIMSLRKCITLFQTLFKTDALFNNKITCKKNLNI